MVEAETTSFDDQLLAELLVSARLITPDQLAEAQARLATFSTDDAIPVPKAFLPDPVSITVKALDPADQSEAGLIPLGEPVGDPGEWPTWSNGQFLVVNPREPGLVEAIAVAPGAALGLFPTSRGTFLYPGATPTRDLSPDVLVLSSPLTSPSAVKSRPIDLVSSPTGEFMVACNRGAGTIHVLVPNTVSQLGAIAVRAAGSKRGLGVAIHGRMAYITDGLTPRLMLLDLTSLKARSQTFPTGPLGPVAVTPDGQHLLMTFYKNSDDLGLLTVTTSDLRVRHLLNLPGRKIAAAPLEPFRITQDGQLAYLVVQEGEAGGRFRLVVVDLGKKKVVKEMPLDGLPLGLALPAPRQWLPEKPDLEQIIVDLAFATHNEIAKVRNAEPSGPPLQDFRLDPQIVGQLPERMMRTMGIVPMFRDDDRLLVAMVNPRDPTGLQLAAQLAGGLLLDPVPIGAEELEAFMADRYPLLMERYHALRAVVPAGGPAAAPGAGGQGGGAQAAGGPGGGAEAVPLAATGAAPAAASGAPGQAGVPVAGVPTAGTPVAGQGPGAAAPAGGRPGAAGGPVPIPASVRPAPPAASAAKAAEAEKARPQVKDYPTSTDSWVGSNGLRVLVVDAIRRQVCEINREKREVWAHRNVVSGGATYTASGNILVVDMGGNKILEIDPRNDNVVWTFGADADRAKQLRGPRAANRLSNGNTLIVDTGNHRVIEVSQAGDLVWSYGEAGRAGCAHGNLFKPQGATREKKGNTVIADTGNHRIISVTEAGEIVWQYGNHANRLGGGQGSGANQLSEPSAAARLETGNLLVADTGNQRVLEIDPMKNILWHYRPGGVKGGTAVRDPVGVWRGADGKTLITGRTGVVEVDADIKVTWEYHYGAGTREALSAAWEAAGTQTAGPVAPAPVSSAQDLPVNLPNTFLIVDRVRSRLMEVDRKSQIIWQFTGSVGGERNRIEHPHFAAKLANGNTLVADTGHHRVVEVRDNAIVWQFGKRAEEGNSLKHLSGPKSAERTPGGTIIVADTGNRRILEVNAAQECVWRKDGLVAPVYAAKLPRGNVLLVDWGAHVVMEIDERGMPVWQFGQMGNNGKGPNQLFHPEHACRLESGNTLICDTQNHRVLEVTPDKQIHWQYGGEPHLLGRKGRFGMQMLTPAVAWRLPTGRTMVHHAGANHVVEVDPELNITWHFTLPG